jgi:gamma-glutamyltranspeptidase/glutathione hydrolase
MPVAKAVETPRVHHQWLPDQLNVEGEIPIETKRSLERRGHAVRERGVLGVVQAITAGQDGIKGAADPRKEERARAE